MNKIENMMQLQFEMNRLRNIAKEQEQQLKNDLLEIKEDLKPANLFMNGIESLTGFKINKKDFLKDGIAYGVSLFFQRFILKTEKRMEKKIYDFMDTVFERINSFAHKHTNGEAQRKEREGA